jgi:hypothetical protein
MSVLLTVSTWEDHRCTLPWSSMWAIIGIVICRVVLSDVLEGKDVVEGRDGRTDGRMCRIVIGHIRVKTELPP